MPEILRFIWPPWDLVAFPTFPAEETGVGGVHVGEISRYIGTEEPTADQLSDGVAFIVKVRTGIGFYFRVREWTLAGSITLVTGEGLTYSGTVSLVVQAITYIDGSPLPDVSVGGPALHGGWYGRNGTPALWTLDGEDFDVGPIELRLGDVTGTPGADFIEGGLAFAPVFSISALPEIVVGKLRPSDNCLVTATLPATIDGSFDGYGDHSFTFRLGTTNDVIIGGGAPSLTGSLTLNPTLLIEY